jgi:type IV pilus assembly protein PilX
MLVRQRGAVLAISLLVLLVMTVLGVAAMGSTTLQERMANNNRQQQVAFQSAEAALRAAENYLGNTINSVTALHVNFNSAAPMIGPLFRYPPASISTTTTTGWRPATRSRSIP